MGVGIMKKTKMLMLMSMPFLLLNMTSQDIWANNVFVNMQANQIIDYKIVAAGLDGSDDPRIRNTGGGDGTWVGKVEGTEGSKDTGSLKSNGSADSSADNGADSSNDPSDGSGKFYENKMFYLGLAGVVVVAAIFGALTYRFFLKRKEAKRLRKSLLVLGGGSHAVTDSNSGTNSGIKTRFRVGNLHNVGRREEQQDSFCLSDIYDKDVLTKKGLLAVVADGMGGLEGGAAISKLVCNTFLRSYTKHEEINNPVEFLYDTAAAAENAVEKYVKQKNVEGGSTLVAVLIKNGKMDYLSVGDSHIYLLRDGNLKQLNREHNFGEVLKEKAARGEVDKNEPYVNPQRHALTAYIGMGSFDIVDRNSKSIVLVPGDKIFLCSDGVYNALKPEAIIAAMSGDAVSAAKRMEQEITAKNFSQQDNFTGVIIEYALDERK